MLSQEANSIYPPHGMPIYWRKQPIPKLMAAIIYYLDLSDGCKELEDRSHHEELIAIVREYFIYWIEAPCWSRDPKRKQLLSELRTDIQEAHTHKELELWQARCFEATIDPI